MKIVTIIGARPQFVKAATISRAIAHHNTASSSSCIEEIIVHTGQHFDANMSDVFFDEMQIPTPHHFLQVNSMGHGAMTGRMLEKIEEVLHQEKPDCVLVYGDTNSTLAGALAAKKMHIKVVHVEAGLRSFNMRMPEEINRIVTDRISDILCCPTDTAVNNLQNEGFCLSSTQPMVTNTGDVMLDAAQFYASFSAERSDIIERLGLGSQPFALCTVHRAENTDDPQRLNDILRALTEISKAVTVVLPLHPRTRKILEATPNFSQFADSSLEKSLIAIDPVGYFDMLELLKATSTVLTDSGGLQKEAYFFSKPCVTLRDETEWVELVESGYNQLAGAEYNRILNAYSYAMRGDFPPPKHLYGEGRAANNVVSLIARLV